MESNENTCVHHCNIIIIIGNKQTKEFKIILVNSPRCIILIFKLTRILCSLPYVLTSQTHKSGGLRLSLWSFQVVLKSIAVYFVLCIILAVQTVFIAVSCGKFRDEWWWRGWHFDGARVLILRTWFLIRTFLAFWVLNGSLFIFQGPYFHCFAFINAKKVNSVCLYTTMVLV